MGGLIVFLAIWALASWGVAIYADTKGRSRAGFFLLSFFTSPILGIIVALIIRPNRAEVEHRAILEGEMKRCPSCAEVVKRQALVCRYCGQDLRCAARPPRKTSALTEYLEPKEDAS